ncbi:A49-like RNA polymerase I associated factor [Fragilaria crotonensis]|nr:A49-like RNA polymerase I associated factor [Fragilaria crotonensis]
MAVKERNTKITVSVEDADPSSDPIVVSFPGGAPVDVNPQFVQRRLREGAKVGRKLVGRDLTCLYQAENLGRGNDGRRTKLCIALYNKKTGTLTVSLAAEKGTVFALEQSIPKYTPVDTEQTTAAQRRKALFQDFGSSKKQKTLKSQEANRVTVDSVIGAGSLMAGAFSAQTKMSASNRKALDDNKRGEKSDAVELAYAEARLLFLPAFDRDAKQAHLVYSARDIAGDEAWGRISRVADACLHTQPTGTTTTAAGAGDNAASSLAKLTARGTWHACVVQILQSIPLDSPHAKNQVKTALLLNSMITFHLQPVLRGDVRSIARQLDINVEVCQRFLDLFSAAMGSGRDSRYATSKPNKDKCRVHLLILYVMALGGRTMKVGTIKPIVDVLKMDMAEAANLLREAGFTVKGASAALTVPLTFPPPKRGGKAK